MDEKNEPNAEEMTAEKKNSSKKSPENDERRTNDREKRSRSRSSSPKRHRRSRSRSRSSSSKRHRRSRSRSRSKSSRHRHHHHHHHRRRHHHHEKSHRRSRTRSRSPRRKRSPSPRRRSPPVRTVPPRPHPQVEQRSHEEERKRLQLEQLEKLRQTAANGTLDLSKLTMDELRKAIDVPKEIRTNQAAVINFQMEEIRKLIEELSGIPIPKIYQSGAVNPLEYAQQQKKRKLLWSKTNDKTSTSRVGAAITDSQDEKNAEKFRKLLGMKANSQSGNESGMTDAIHQQQQNTFDSLDREYETARITTHLRRGVGLGFLSQGPFVPSSEKN